jgi:hypothetical protein
MHASTELLLGCLSLVRSAALPSTSQTSNDPSSTALVAAAPIPPVDNSTLVQNSAPVRGANTAIAIFAALLTAVTYAVLIRSTDSVAYGMIIPKSFVQEIIRKLMEKHFIEASATREILAAGPNPETNPWQTDEQGPLEDRTILVDLAAFRHSAPRGARVRGVFTNQAIWADTASPAMKNLLQAAVWEYVCLWLVIAMVATTSIYNGFIYQQPGPDAVLRLVLVVIYALATFVQVISIAFVFQHALTALGKQACLAIIARRFAFSTVGEYHEWLSKSPVHDGLFLRKFRMEALGSASLSKVYKSHGALNTTDYRPSGSFETEELPTTKSTMEKFAKPLRESEIKTLEKATEAALDRVLSNVVLVLGICLANGLAPWSSSARSFDATTTQIGSYALLVALGTGMIAQLASITHIRNAATSIQVLSRLQACVLVPDYSSHIGQGKAPKFHPAEDNTAICYSARESALRLRDIWLARCSWRQVALAAVFGPGLLFIPRREDIRVSKTLAVKLTDKTYELESMSEDSHCYDRKE